MVWLFGGYTSAKLDTLADRVEAANEKLAFRVRQFEQIREELVAWQEQQLEKVAVARADVADAQRTIRQLETALDEERQKVQVHETTINTLVAAHGLILERYEAETAIEIQKKVAAMPQPRE